MQTKRCPKCGQVKAVEEFSKNKSERDGLCCWCKKCAAESRKKNKEKIARSKAEYYKNNKDKMAEYFAEYRKKNKERISQYFAEYRKNNKDKKRKREKEYRERLSRDYIKHLLNKNGISDEQITTELIEAKRQQIQLHRLIKEGKNVVNRTGN